MTKKISAQPCDSAVSHVRRNLPDQDVAEALARLFKVLGDPTRVRLLWILSMEELCVDDLAQVTGMSQSAVSHQLHILRQAKLVRPRREGRKVYYALADAHVSLLFSQGLEHVQEKEN
jgi:DNA-binding transcriptional ArsR family regulator